MTTTTTSTTKLKDGTESTHDILESTDTVLEGTLEDNSPTMDLLLDLEPLNQLSQNKRVTVPRNTNFSRKDVVNAFQAAFELIGGVPRLAIWADTNQTEFYKLYGKLIPSGNSSALGETNKIDVLLSVGRSPLDE